MSSRLALRPLKTTSRPESCKFLTQLNHCSEQEINGRTDAAHEIPINSGPMTINTSLFEGKLEVHLKGLPTSQKRVFEGKKRFFQIMCQVCGWRVSSMRHTYRDAAIPNLLQTGLAAAWLPCAALDSSIGRCWSTPPATILEDLPLQSMPDIYISAHHFFFVNDVLVLSSGRSINLSML